MKDRSPARTVVTLVLADLLLSSTIPLLANAYKRQLSGAESILLGTMIFCAALLLEVLYHVTVLKERAAKADIVWDSHESTDSKLASVRKSLRTLEQGVEPQSDLFLRYFKNRIHALEAEVRQAAGSRELRVDSQNLDLSEPLLDTFTGRSTDILRIVHFFADNDALFNVHEAQWFYRVYDAAVSRRIVEVRRLLIYADRSELQDEKSLRLMGFIDNTEHYDYRVLARANFNRLCQSFRIQGEFADFGIYGERYLFRGILYADGDFVGSYSKDPETVARYISFFDFCWEGPTSRRITDATLPRVPLEDLFDPDS